MNTSENLSGRKHLLPTICLVGAVASFLLIGILCYGVTGYFRLGRDVKALRNSVMESTAADWDRKIEINIGAFTLGLAQAGLGFVELKSEVRAALRSLRSGEAGYYRLRPGQAPRDHGAMLSAADAAMAGRGWERLVGVVDRHELVAIYLPREMKSVRDVNACLVVMNGRELVVAGGRSDLEPLIQFAASKWESRRKGGWSIRL